MAFFISLFLGIRTEALRAAAIKLSHEQMAAGEAFHPHLAAPGDFILCIVTQEKVGTRRIGDVYRVDPSFSALVLQRTVAVRVVGHIVILIVIFLVPVHTALYQAKILMTGNRCYLNLLRAETRHPNGQ
jgi:hypothetical protein